MKSTAKHLPNLIIIGAQKCATSSFHYYLSLHPQIHMSREKELNFFIQERNWNKGLEWYKSHFTADAPVLGEASPNYTNYPIYRGVPQRMVSTLGKIKLIYLVRDPVERIVSHYTHRYVSGFEDRAIDEALRPFHDGNPYICRSKYYMQLQQFLDYFPEDTILTISREDALLKRGDVLADVFRFLGVDESFTSTRFMRQHNRSRIKRRNNRAGRFLESLPCMKIIDRLPYRIRWNVRWLIFLPFSYRIKRPKLSDTVRNELAAYLADDVRRLRKLTGKGFTQWCV